VPSNFNALNAAAYEQMMGRWSRRLAPLFIDFAGVQEGERLIDVGCGTGSLTFALLAGRNPAALTAIDYSELYLEAARAAGTDPRLRFEQADACALPFADGAFDGALSLLMLHFVPRPELAAAEMRRVVRRGGTVAAAVWDTYGGFVMQRMFWDTAALLDPAAEAARAENYMRPATRPNELREMWRRVGLEDVRDAMLTIRMEYASFDDLWSPSGRRRVDGQVRRPSRPRRPRRPRARAPVRLRGRQARRPALLRRRRLGLPRHRGLTVQIPRPQ
jgi:ubiquinone/menaquinone biosynthesis C-methylase UbiE